MNLIGYVRVSDERENPTNQKYNLYEWASRNGHRLLEVYEDIGISGSLPPKSRPGFSKLLENLDKADGILVASLDRIARSLFELVSIVKEIEQKGKVVLSVREEWLHQLDPKIRSLILAVLGFAAEMELLFIKERTKEALRRAKAQGKRLGRPPTITNDILEQTIKYIEKGYKVKEIAKILGVNHKTLTNYLNKGLWRVKYYEARLKAARRGVQS